jgi:hypothetical protein
MSIQRFFNSLWAVIGTGGMVHKIATHPYNPSPGGAVAGANNQAVAAVRSSTPFILVDANGISPDVHVNTSLDDGSKIANPPDPPAQGVPAPVSPTPLDENSRSYHVTRQYGDIYLFNDGNIISWGGNGKNFSFGNGYEENHAWASLNCVYNNEVFPIPAGAMSTPACFSTVSDYSSPTDGVAEYEWLGGNVSKNWGVDYGYNYGSSYEWSAGPDTYIDAYGTTGDPLPEIKKGKHCAYSYGTGYEESLIAWDNGSGWFHADDSNSPYASRKHDDWNSGFLSMESVASSFAQDAGDQATSALLGALGVTGSNNEEAIDTLSEGQALDDAVFNPQDFAKRNKWQAVNLKVSKDFGNTYEYHYGPGLSIQEGPTEERNYGNTSSTVVGNSTESVTGNSSSTVTGNSSESVTGNATSMVQGNSTEQFWGGKAEFFMGGKSEMSLGACDEINLAAKVEIVAGVALEIFLGFKTEIGSAGSLEFELGPDLKLTPADAAIEEATAKIAVLEAGQATLANFAMTAADVVMNV